MASLFHLLSEAAWAEAQGAGLYRPPSLATEGFIHLSTEAQWRATAARFFRGQAGLRLLELDAEALAPHVRFEAADGDAFPHLYAPLQLTAVRSSRALAVAEDGAVTFR